MSNDVYTCENKDCPNYHQPLYDPKDGKCPKCKRVLAQQSTQELEKE